jgi:MFS family permease
MAAFMKTSILSLLTKDGRVLFVTRSIRLFAYGAISVVLALYLAEIGMSGSRIGLLLSLTLLGDTAISLWITTLADRMGRKRMLILGAALMVLAGLLFVLTENFFLLLIAATVGVISPSGYEVGPFLSIEQACLSHIVPSEKRTSVFAWYNLAGSFTTAGGALGAGLLVQALGAFHVSDLAAYRLVILGYAIAGLALAALFTRLSASVEVPREDAHHVSLSKAESRLGLHKSKSAVLKLSALFSMDAFAGGFILQSMLAYWFHLRFGVEPGVLGSIFFGANILAGISALSASKLAARVGLINTMVFTHIPSNILLMMVPLMPSLSLAITVLLLRFSISQMDVPARQSYTMAMVAPDERSAAAGITGVARTTGAALSPVLAGHLFASAGFASLPFFLSGGIKIVYDLLLYRIFRKVKTHEAT